MTSPSGEFQMARFSTDYFTRAERTSAWREFFGRTIVNLDIEPLADRTYRSGATVMALPDLLLMAGSCSGAHYRMTRQLASTDDVALLITTSDRWNAQQIGRDVMLGPGDAILMSNGDPGLMTNSRPGPVDHRRVSEYCGLRLPRHVMSLLVNDLDDALVRPIPAENGALRLLMNYLRILRDPGTFATPELHQAIATHVHDLVAIMIGATRDAAEVADGRGVRAARLHAIKADVAENFDRPNLSVAEVALRHGVTPRYVQMLFETEGTTFTEFVLAQRLLRCYRMLTDPRRADRTVITIAFDAGFGSLAYFNRSFRRQFGGTPSDVRATAALNE